MKVNFFKQSEINSEYKQAFFQNASNLFDGSTFLVNGSFTQNFENQYSSFLGCKYCAFVSNGLDALILALEALDVCEGDIVVVPNHTYIATWIAPLKLGCKLMIAPVDENTLLIDPDYLAKHLSSNTKVVMPVHLYGNACDIDSIKTLRSEYDFHIVEDAAQAHGSQLDEKYVGDLGDLTCFSFYPTKNLGALGEGGAVTSSNNYLHEKICSLRNYGRSPVDGAINEYCGLNRRGDEIQAAFLLEKLKNLDSIKHERLKLINIYQSKLAPLLPDFQFLPYSSGSSPHLAILKTKNIEIRNRLRDYLRLNHIQTAVHYSVPCHEQPFIKRSDLLVKSFSVLDQAKRLADCIVSLPLSEAHTEEEINYVCKIILDFSVLA